MMQAMNMRQGIAPRKCSVGSKAILRATLSPLTTAGIQEDGRGRATDTSPAAKPSLPAAPRQHSFFYFDPLDPEHCLVEVKATGASQATLAAQRRSATAASSAGVTAGRQSMSLMSTDTTDSASLRAIVAKSAAMQQQLVEQLGMARERISELQKYESMCREWRMRSERASSEGAALRKALADKDGELASAYGRLEAAAADRAAIRKSYEAMLTDARAEPGATSTEPGAPLWAPPPAVMPLKAAAAGVPPGLDDSSFIYTFGSSSNGNGSESA